ncbi:MAG: hypothetical protein IPN34_26875 [Planctomycetes bacterium]|nr:hypothetical protein [Planctomycetota bacterium]
MRIGQELRQGAEQRLLLLPKMLQAIEVLQLPVEDLAEHIEQAIAENEALVAAPVESAPSKASAPARREAREKSADQILESAPAHGEGLVEHLRCQVALATLAPVLERAVQHVIAHIDPSTGWLVADESALAASFELASDPGLWTAAIAFVQQLEPRGVGGRGSIECLLLQLDPADPHEEIVRRVLVEFLEDVSKNRLPKVAKRLGISIDELRASLEHARGFRLRPERSSRAKVPHRCARTSPWSGPARASRSRSSMGLCRVSRSTRTSRRSPGIGGWRARRARTGASAWTARAI